MLRTLAISSFLFTGAVSVANADVYRSVDEHGGVHYSDQWTPGSQLIKSTKARPYNTAPTSTSPSKVASAPADASSSGEQKSASQAMKQDKAKAREQQCKEAKDRYDKAIEARRIYKTTDGAKTQDNSEGREYLSDDQADAYRVKARQEMQELCGASAK